jgi:hypothetical protein
VADNKAVEVTSNPGYCEFCGPDCSHCFDPERKKRYPGAGVFAFDKSVGKWVCGADYDYEANQND